MHHPQSRPLALGCLPFVPGGYTQVAAALTNCARKPLMIPGALEVRDENARYGAELEALNKLLIRLCRAFLLIERFWHTKLNTQVGSH